MTKPAEAVVKHFFYRKILFFAVFVILFFAGLLVWTQPTQAAISFVQATSTRVTTAGSTVTVLMTNNVAGDFIVVGCREGANITSITATSISDTAGNTYTLVATSSPGSGRMSGMFYAANIAAAANNTITCNYGSSLTTTKIIIAQEFSGIATVSPLDGYNKSNNSGSVTTLASGNITTTNANDLLVYSINEATAQTGGWTAGSGYTIQNNASTTQLVMQYNIVAATNTYSTSMTWNQAGTADSVFAAFEATAAPATFTISGTLYSDEGVTQVASIGKVIKVRVGTSTPGIFSTSTVAANGFWQIPGISTTGLGLGTPIIAWVDGDATTRAAVFTMASSTSNNITSLNLYQNRIIVKHEATSATSTTNALLDTYEGASDSDIQFTVSSNNLTVNAGQRLYVWPGDTYAPGGTVTLHGNAATGVDGDIYIGASSTFTSGGNISLAGGFFASSSAVFTPGSYTMTFTATTTRNIYATSTPLGNVTFNGSGGTWTFRTQASTTDFTITVGTVTAPSVLSIAGNYSNSGDFADNSGTIYFTGSSKTIAGTLIGANDDFYNMVFTNSGSWSFSNNASTTDFTITSGTVTAPSLLTIAGNYSNSGDFADNSGTIYFTGSSKTIAGSLTGASDDFYNLIFIGSYTFSNNASTSNNFTINSGGTAVISSRVITIAGAYVNSGTLTSSTGTIYFTGTTAPSGTLTGTTGDLGNVVLAYSGTVTWPNASTTNLTINSGATLGAPALLTISGSYSNSGTFTKNAGTVYLNGTAAKTLSGNMTGTSAFNNVIVNNTNTTAFSANASTSNFTINTGAGLVTLYTLFTISGNFSNSATFDAQTNSNTLYVSSSSAQTLGGTLAGTSADFNNIIFLGASTKTFSNNASTTGDFTISAGTVAAPAAGRLTIGGAYTNSGTFTHNGSTVYFSGASETHSGTMTGTSAFNHVVFDAAGTALGGNASTTNLTIDTGATLTPNASSLITIVGNYLNSGTFTHNNATLYISSTTAQTLGGTMTNSSSLYNVIFLGSGTKTFSANASTTNFTIISGSGAVSAASSGLLSIAGNYSNSATFTANSCTVYISGSSQQTLGGTMIGTSAFYNLQILNSSGGGDATNTPSVIFSASASTTATFTLTTANTTVRFATSTYAYTFQNINWVGTAGNVIKLRSDYGAGTHTKWKLKVPGTRTAITYVDVMDSDASYASNSQMDATAAGNQDSGNNTNWLFGASPADLTWATGSADFEIYATSTLTWDNGGTPLCSGTLTDDNAATISCSSGAIAASTQYRVQVILKNAGGTAASMSGSEYIDYKAVKAGWAGTTPTLGTCGFYDVGADDTSATCNAAWNSNDVRLTNSGTTVSIAATTGQEGFMFLITTDTSVPASDANSYWDSSIDSVTEDSSKITVTGPTTIPETTIQRYRSVGANTNLNTQSKTVTISGNTATFSGSMPNNIGVGDVLQYQNGATYLLAFIHGRTDALTYTVYTSAGAAPTATTSATVSVYRAYTNLYNWEAQTENISINSSVRNFDSSTDLTTGGGTVMNVVCYASSTPDTAAVTITGWTTGASNYIRIYTPTSTAEVGASQRHSGVWDSSKYSLVATNAYAAIFEYEEYVWIDGLQIRVAGSLTTYQGGIVGAFNNANSNFRISNNIVDIATTGSNTKVGLDFDDSTYLYVRRVWNNIVYYTGSGATETQGIWDGDGTSYVYNNTVYGMTSGFRVGGSTGNGTAYLLNNIAYGNTTNYAVIQGTFTGDYNLSGPGSSSGMPGSHSRNSTLVNFATVAGRDLHLAANDTGAIGYGTSTPASTDAYLTFKDDIDNEARPSFGTAWDIGADNLTIRNIFRSVGPSNVTALASSTGATMTIENNTATFSSSLANNIGVGDVVVYNANGTTTKNSVAFINGRTSAIQYSVQTVNGRGYATSTTNSISWQIFRAYTTLANIDTNNAENTGIPAALRYFDNFTNGKNLASSTEIWNVPCYSDAADSGFSIGTGGIFLTSTSTYVRFYTPTSTSEVGISQRHNGVWDSSKFRIAFTGVSGEGAIYINSNHVKIDGFQIGSNGYAVRWYLDQGKYAESTFSNSIIDGSTVSDTYARALNDLGAGVVPAKIYVYNNVIYNYKTTGSEGVYLGTATTRAYVYNNTLYNNAVGIDGDGATVMVAKNNLVASTTDPFYGTFTAGTDYNSTDKNDTPTGGTNTNHRVNQVFGFADKNATNRDLHLAANDTGAIGYGTSTPYSSATDSNLNFTTDIDGESRPAYGTAWDIGADDMTVRNIYRSVGPSNTTALASSTGATMTIENNVATFSSALADNIGVGDVIVYNANASTTQNKNSVAFINGRSSGTSYSVQSVNGRGNASSTYQSVNWQIFRAYTSLANAIDSAAGGTENTGLPDSLENFDISWSASHGKNIASTTETWNVAAYGDAVDSTVVTISGWTTATSTYMRIYTPTSTAEVGASQRHQGVWDSGKYNISVSAANNNVIDIYAKYVKIDGLQIANSGAKNSNSVGISASISSATSNISISGNIIAETGSGTAADGTYGIRILNTGATTYVWNNIVYDFYNGYSLAYVTVGNYYVYNNTFIDAVQVQGVSSLNYVLKNNIFYGGFSDGTDGGGVAVSVTNLTTPTASFVNSGIKDFHLASSDTAASEKGTSLASDTYLPFAYDIDNDTRPQGSLWDIGADECTNCAIAPGGVLSRANHTQGQIANQFTSATSLTTWPLFAFQLIPTGGDVSVTGLVFSLTGIHGFVTVDVTSAALYNDFDSDSAVDAGDTAVGGTGAVAISGSNGTIAFSSSFTATTSRDYLMTASVADIGPSDELTIGLEPFSFTSNTSGDMSGVISRAWHGKVTGLAAGSGITSNEPNTTTRSGGSVTPPEEIGNEPGFFPPTSNGSPMNEWNTGANGIASDNIYASSTVAGKRQDYAGFSFGIPAGVSITGIEIKIEAFASTAAGTVQVAVASSTSSFSSAVNATTTLTVSDTVYRVGGESSAWGGTWLVADFSSGFTLRVIGQASSNTVYFDAVQVKIHYQSTGGGSSGGGDI